MLAVAGLFLAGLALFFFGVAGIRTNLQQITGRRFRRLLTRWTRHGALAGAWGFLFGAITQSATAVSFILAGLIAGGSLNVSRALMVVGWANVGTAVLVFLAAINVQLAVLYVVGLTGLAVTFDVAPRFKPGLSALFSIGLLFFGLNLMKQAFAPLPGFPWFQTVAESARGSEIAAAALGMLLRTVVQSSSAIAVLALILSHAGLLTDTQLVMVIFGAAIGVTLSSYLLSSELKGIPRQIVLFHGGINGVAGLLCVGLALFERATGWPLILSWIAHAPGDADNRLSFAFLFVMLVVAGVAAASARRAPAWLNRWSPPTFEQGLSQPRYLQNEALHDPEAALDLAEQEEEALLARMPAYLEAARALRGGRGATVPPAAMQRETVPPAVMQRETVPPAVMHRATLPPEAMHRALAAVAKAIEEFGTGLADQHLSRASSSRLLALERRLGLLEALNDSLHAFAAGAAEQTHDGPIGTLIDNLVEAADTVLGTAIDCWKTRDEDDLATFAAMTEDRGTMMERIRRTYAEGDAGLEHKDKAGLFHLTSLFERIIWLLRQVGLSLRERE
jgi:phosphate:Na+ symporter